MQRCPNYFNCRYPIQNSCQGSQIFTLLQKFLFVWCVQYLPPASAMVGGNVDECQKRVHMIFEEPESLYAIFAFVFCPFGSHLQNKRLQCTFPKCLKVRVWNAWYGFNSHRKFFSGVLDLPLQIVVMSTPEIISSKLWKAITLVLFNQLLAETCVQMCYCRSIEQGLHIDQVAQRMVGYSRQQVKWVFISLSFASHLCMSLICAWAWFVHSRKVTKN
jgi:hypothetical protein